MKQATAKEPNVLPPGKATEYFRKANGSWPPEDERLDPELHRLLGCICQRGTNETGKGGGR